MQVADVGKRSRVSSEASSGAALQPQTMLDPASQLGLHLFKSSQLYYISALFLHMYDQSADHSYLARMPPTKLLLL
jgi:hypothetical protein